LSTVYLDNHAHALLVFQEGKRFNLAIWISRKGVKVVKFEKSQMRYMRPAELGGRPYPVARAVRHFRRAGRSLGITKGASKALKEIT
jgi:hypothetical protein